jgi:glycosyltransferase involved in cell wall biosynthesis
MSEKTLIIIPAYNEENNLPNTITLIKKILPKIDIVIINDGSSDKTAMVVQKPGVTMVNHSVNLGDGAARQTGFKFALMNNYEYAVHLDADGQHDAAYVPVILNELKKGQYDIIIGSRYLSDKRYRIPFLRYVGMKIFSLIATAITRNPITDPTSGFRGINRKAMEFYVKHFYPQSYPDADVIIASHYAGLKIKEIPVSMIERKYGKSLHGGLSPVYYIYKMFLSIFMMVIIYNEGGKNVD